MENENFTESQMEKIHAQARQFESKVKKYWDRGTFLVMGLAVSLSALSAIVIRWQREEWWWETLAVMFLATVIRSGIDIVNVYTVTSGLLMMAIVLFTLP